MLLGEDMPEMTRNTRNYMNRVLMQEPVLQEKRNWMSLL